MPGPPPKAAGQRRRRNKVAGATTLHPVEDAEIPPLPDGFTWHPLTVSWWSDIHLSPMAAEWDESDRHGLYVLAALVNEFWFTRDPKAATEIRLQRQAFGLTPIDRRRLQWEIDRGEGAEHSRAKRRTSGEASKPATGDRPDPRGLYQVK